jgi:hypothetical protein
MALSSPTLGGLIRSKLLAAGVGAVDGEELTGLANAIAEAVVEHVVAAAVVTTIVTTTFDSGTGVGTIT